jgi:hypothetical protein
MGTVARFDLMDLIVTHGLKHFVETGTGAGEGLNYAAGFPFRSLRSCEIEVFLAERAQQRFVSESRVHVFRYNSVSFLDWACRMLPRDEPILFWLDAHFPGADYGIRSYDAKSCSEFSIPLEHELETIAMYRPEGQDVILCDDLRIYKDGKFSSGNVPEHIRTVCPTTRNIDFVHQIMGVTHDIMELYDHEGYIMMEPKDV